MVIIYEHSALRRFQGCFRFWEIGVWECGRFWPQRPQSHTKSVRSMRRVLYKGAAER